MLTFAVIFFISGDGDDGFDDDFDKIESNSVSTLHLFIFQHSVSGLKLVRSWYYPLSLGMCNYEYHFQNY